MRPTTEVVVWWVVLGGLWILTLSTVSAPEAVTGAVCALPCAVAARAARRAMKVSWRPRYRWWGWLSGIPLAAVRESAASLVRVFRRPTAGRFDEVTVPAEPGPVHEARLAVSAVVIGCAPGTMVVASPPEERRLVVHRLLERSSAQLDRVSR